MKLNSKIKIRIVITIFLVIFLVFVNNIYIYGREDVDVSSVGYLEENGNFVLPVVNNDDMEYIAKNAGNLENPKIKINKKKTLLDYTTEQDSKQYTTENQEELVKGVELKINNQIIYLKNESLIEEAKNSLVSILLSDKIVYEEYLQTNTLDDFTIDNIKVTGISFDDDISFKNTYVPQDELIISSRNTIFALFHKDYYDEDFEFQKYVVQDDETFEDVLEENDLSKVAFYINNPEYKNTPLLKAGDEIIINDLDPIINVVTYYEEQVYEEEAFDTIRKEEEDIEYGEEEVEQEGVNGESLVTYNNKMVNGEIVSKTVASQKVIEEPVDRIILEGTEEDEESTGYGGTTVGSSESNSVGFIWPSDSHSISRGLSSGHNGTDITGAYGSPEYAAAAGVVEEAGWSPYGGGYEVAINHGGGVYTIYSHQSQPPPVSVGQTVSQGQVIGYMGNTGYATGTHLHFEVQVGCTSGPFSGTPVEPYNFM